MVRVGEDTTMSDKVEGYASALATLAGVEGDVHRVANELHQLGNAVDTNDELRTTLIDRSIPASRRIAIIEELMADKASPVTLNLVNMVIGAGRGGDLAAIADAVVAKAAQSRGQVVAEVRSAVPLSEDQQSRLAAALGSATGREIDIKVIVDPDVLGGIFAQVGDAVFDGSVRTRLENMKERLS
ncbi:MAG: F-type H+-transporting ATPase subunit delta [Candidatus Poriferisodalaceae bacterium]|jgi:F-type H+-transporting ATPase subunit delta